MFFQGQGKVEISPMQFFCSVPEAGESITEKSKMNTHTDIKFFKSPWENCIC